jgi:uncharacterized membrane protein
MKKAAMTVYRSRNEVERLWNSPDHRPDYIVESGWPVQFKDAPGDRGTEIHVDLEASSNGGAGIAAKLSGAQAKVKDELRRFKQLVETGEIARSEGTPEGERAERKLKQRPAQPLQDSELQKVGV